MIINNSPGETRNPDSEESYKQKVQRKDSSSAKSKLKKTYPEAANALGALQGLKNEFLTTEAGETDGMILVQNGLKAQQLIADMLNEDEDNNLNEFEDGRKSRLEFQKLQVIDIATGIISMLGVALTVIAYDIEFEERDEDRLFYFLWLQIATTVVASISVVIESNDIVILNMMRHVQLLKFMKAKNMISAKETLFSSGGIYWIAPEIIIQLLQPYPFLQGIKVYLHNDYHKLEYFYHANDFLSLLVVLRIYIILRFILNTTIYRSPSAHRLSNMYGADNTYLYSLKSLMKVAPFTVSMILLVGSIFVFGYMVRIAERPLNRYPGVEIDYSSYWNCFWNVIVTMTTVGYGDIFPRTHLGRIIVFIVCIWGMFVVSLMVVTLTNVLTMSSGEEKALTVLQRLELRKGLKSEAAYVLTLMARIGLNNRKITDKNKRKLENQKVINRLKVHTNHFRRIARQIRSVDSSGNISEEMTRQFEFIRDEIKVIAQKQQGIQGTVSQICEMFGVKSNKNDHEATVDENENENSQ